MPALLNRIIKYEEKFFIFCSLAWMVIIYFLSSIPGEYLGSGDTMLTFTKKLGHFCLYGILAVLYVNALKAMRTPENRMFPRYLMSLLFATLYAISDEYHQSFVPGRLASTADVVIDVCGAITALAVSYGRKTDKPATDEGKG